MFCPKCGRQLPDTAAFCDSCGQPFRSTVPPVQQPVPPVAPQSPQEPCALQKYCKAQGLTGMIAKGAAAVMVLLFTIAAIVLAAHFGSFGFFLLVFCGGICVSGMIWLLSDIVLHVAALHALKEAETK